MSRAVKTYAQNLQAKTQSSKDRTFACLQAGLPMLKFQKPLGSRHNRDEAKKKRKLVEKADMEPDDIALIHRMRASSLDQQTTKMPWFATNTSQWDQDMEKTSLDLSKSERAEAWRALNEKPRLPAPNLDNDQSISSSSSSSSTSSSSSAEAAMASQAHPAAEAMAGETEFSWAVYAPRCKLYLHSLKGGACIVDSGLTSR